MRIHDALGRADHTDILVAPDNNEWIIAPNAVTDAKLRDSAALSVIGRSANSVGDPADIIAANAGELLRRYANVVAFGSTMEGNTTWDDNTEVRLGTGSDLRLFHNGANSVLRNDTGTMNFLAGVNVAASYSTLGVWTFTDTPIVPDDSWTNTKLANMAQATIKGRAAGAGTGDPTDLTGTQATAVLDVFTAALKGLAPASGGGTANFLRADGAWASPASSVPDPLLLGNGTAGAPTYSFASDPDTGIYRAAANNAAIATGGVRRVQFGSFGVRMDVAGSGGAPAINFDADPATGIYLLAGNSLAFATAGATRLVLDSVGRIYAPDLHNNASLPIGTANPYIASGTYTPTGTTVISASSVTPDACQWLRVGNVVTVSGSASITASVATGLVAVRLTLPLTSALASATQLAGAGAENTGIFTVSVSGDATNDQALVRFQTPSASSFIVYFTFTYLML